VKILAVSDQIVDRVYTLVPSGQFPDVDLILGCGDLPYTYLEYIVTMLNVPLYYVPGNHDPQYNPLDMRSRAEGGINLDLKTVYCKNTLIGGFGGCVRYRPDGTNQYTQKEAYLRAFRMLPHLLANRLKYGRALDVLISHSPPLVSMMIPTRRIMDSKPYTGFCGSPSRATTSTGTLIFIGTTSPKMKVTSASPKLSMFTLTR
jgi:uncharacterized protein